MQWLEMHNMEYGECIVLGGKSTILMVDCGTINQYIREGETPCDAYIQKVGARYAPLQDRRFLLTHYHRDHLYGFLLLLKDRPGYFSRVYLPASPEGPNGTLPLIDFALFAHIFLTPQNGCSQVNTLAIRAFDRIGSMAGLNRVTVLGGGDCFSWDGTDYEVLWPQKEDFPFPELFLSVTEELNVLLSNPYSTGVEKDFLSYKEEFCRMYAQCCRNFSPTLRASEEKCLRDVNRLRELLEVMGGLREELNRSPAAPDIRELLEQPSTRSAYSEAANAASLVFHNRRTSPGMNDILLTGDITPEALEQLADCLYDGYYIVKAPHHGTASGFSSLFRELAISHILISNGEYHAGGAISQEYLELEGLRHCTNPSQCKWMQTTGSCCNRLACCYEQPSGRGLAIKCPAAGGGKDSGCGIYVLGPTSQRGCLCDVKAENG